MSNWRQAIDARVAAAPREWMVVADDRTGAFEVASLFAQVVGKVVIHVDKPPGVGNGVVDLGTRGLTPRQASELASAIDVVPFTWLGHKIDSTLRGNWAVELATRQRATGRRVVVMPGWPEMGRTCVDGVVSVAGRPIGNVLDHLDDAALLADARDLHVWLAGDGTLAVCDVPNSNEMHAAASVLAGTGTLVAGPAGPLGAAFAADRGKGPPTPAGDGWGVKQPVLVVCGSANPVAREQVRRLRAALPHIEVMATPETIGELVERPVIELAKAAIARIRAIKPNTIVVVGGETAAHMLGKYMMSTNGFGAYGMPRLHEEDGRGPHVITKAGGFGGPDALVDLLRGENG